MAYVDLATIFDPAPDEAPPAEWGDQIRDNFEALPRGVVASKAVTASRLSSGASATDATDLSITFTAPAGRRYRARFSGGIFASGGGATQGVIIHADESNAVHRQTLHLCSTQVNHTESTYEFQPAAGSVTRKIRIARNLGSSDNFGVYFGSAAQAATYTIEDVGPAL